MLASLLLALLGAFERRTATVTRVPPAQITVDADLADWNFGIAAVSPPFAIAPTVSTLEEGTVRDGSDASAELALVSDATDYFVAALVSDDAVVSEPHGGDMYRADMIDLVVWGPKPIHLGFSAFGDAHVFKGELAAGCVDSRAARWARGWVLEARLAKRCINLQQANFALRDADPGESPPAHLAWSGYRHNLPTSTGHLVVGTAAPKASWPEPAWLGKVRVTQPLVVRGEQLMSGTQPVTLRLVNFQGLRHSWQKFWELFDEAQVGAELDLAVRLGANSVRAFLYFESFGADQPKPEMMGRLERFVGLCRARGLLVTLSFFADKKDFRRERYDEMRAQLQKTVSHFRSDPTIAMWDLMNEPDQAFEAKPPTASRQEVAAWVKEMISALRAADPTHLVTVGWSGHDATSDERFDPPAQELWALADVISIHGYFTEGILTASLARVKRLGKPVVLQEFGRTQLHVGEGEAAADYRAVCGEATRMKLAGFGAWELFDHPTGTLPHVPGYDETDENHYGLLTTTRSPKATAHAFAHCLNTPRFELR